MWEAGAAPAGTISSLLRQCELTLAEDPHLWTVMVVRLAPRRPSRLFLPAKRIYIKKLVGRWRWRE